MDGKENSVNDSKGRGRGAAIMGGGESSYCFFVNRGHLQVLIMPVPQF